MRPSRSSASCVTRASSPSSHAIRNWRPWMVTLTCGMAPSGLVRREHGSDRVDGGVEPLSDFTVHAFQRAAARGRGIKLRRKPRAVGAKRVQLRVKGLLAAIGLVPPLDSGGRRIERKRKTLAGDVDALPSVILHGPLLGRLQCGFVSRVAGKIFRVSKQLQGEAYVACGLAVNV